VQGRTGAVLITSADVGAAPASHSHNVTQVSGLSGVAVSGSYTSLSNIPSAFQPTAHTHSSSDISQIVTSVQGRTGSVALTITDITAAAFSHTHSVSQVTGLAYPVTQVQGRTGSVTLTITDISAASATHAHNFVSGGTAVSEVVVLTQSAFSSIVSPSTATLYFIT
jgi:hypothetical protein